MADSLPPTRQSKFDGLKAAAANPFAVLSALAMAITGLTTALKTSADNEAKARMAYEALREASQQNTVAIEACRQGTLELRSWVQQLTVRSEQRQATTEKVIKTKVTRQAASPVPTLVVEPAPVAPSPPPQLAPSTLPPFDGL